MRINLKFVFILVCAISIFSAVPRVINYQGKLTSAGGIGMNDTLPMTFRIFNNPTTGSALWTEVHSGTNEVPVVKGLFDVKLGEITAINLPFDVQYWLEIEVNGNILTPRVKLASSPYAFRAAIAESLVGGSASAGGDSFVAYWDSIRAKPAGFADNIDDVIGIKDTMIAQWDSLRGIPTGFADGIDNTDCLWEFLISDIADTTVVTKSKWGIARKENVLFGNADSTHVNLGVSCTTGTEGSNFKYITVSGGFGNRAFSEGSFIGGGLKNVAIGHYSVIGGGVEDTVNGFLSAVLSGYANYVGDSLNDTASVICGGSNNVILGKDSFIGGGNENFTWYPAASLVGGWGNQALGQLSFVGGGGGAIGATSYSNIAGSAWSVIGGGGGNVVLGYGGTIGGGVQDTVYSRFGGVFSGYRNLAGDAFTDTTSVILGGFMNRVTGGFSIIGGGRGNTVAGDFSVIPGGRNNSSTRSYTYVFGNGASDTVANTAVFNWGTGVGTFFIGQNAITSTYRIYVNGNGYITGAWTASDIDFKTNIKPIENPLSIINGMRPVSYTWKMGKEEYGIEGGRNDYGFIAQDLRQVLPELVREGADNDHLAINYDHISAINTAAIKELMAEIEKLKAENEKLKNAIEKLGGKIE